MKDNLTVREFLEAKRDLEFRLTELIKQEVTQFYEVTGRLPKGISVDTVEIHHFGCLNPDYQIVGVKVDSSIG